MTLSKSEPPLPETGAVNTILAIDDSPANLSLISMLLEEFFPGTRVLTSQNGKMGLECARRELPDIVLLDAMMPEMDGFAVCKALKATPATAAIPVLMVSAVMTNSEARVNGLNGGADGFICKPYQAQELVAQIAALLRLKRTEDELRRHKDELERELEKRTGDLIESETKFRSVFENAPDAILIQDADGVILDANPIACTLHGLDRDALIGRNALDFIPEAKHGNAKKDYASLLQGGRGTVEGERLHSNGTVIPVEIRGGQFELHGKQAALLHLRNITELKEAHMRETDLQARLIRSQRMESLGILAGGVAHDLNNILGPIVAYPELILDALPPDAACREDVEQIGHSAARAVAVIQDLLALARRGNYQTEPVNLNETIESYERSPEFKEQQALCPQVRLALHLQSELPSIIGSTPHLMQVLMNLINNAFEAMPHGGRVTVQTSCEYVQDRVGVYDTITGGDYVLLRVTDQGAGISPGDLEHIFEPFYTRKQMGRSGSGLGLPVVYGIVKDLKGHIEVKTRPGHGAEFTLYFPVTAQSVGRTQQLDPQCLRGTETILVVDDVCEQRVVAQALLNSLGYRVTTADTGQAAVDYARDHRVDLVVLDMILEDRFDGLDTYREILRTKAGQPCVLVSGFSETNRVRKAQALGAGAYVRKPFTRSRLAHAIRSELDRTKRVAA